MTQVDKSSLALVAGHTGMVGSALVRNLARQGFREIAGVSSHDLDLRERSLVFKFVKDLKPRYAFLAAARVGGILANKMNPVGFLSENLQIQTSFLDACLEADVEKVIFLGSSCIYPKLAQQPISESSLMTGKLEETNDAYAIAKIAGVMHVEAIRRQYSKNWFSVMPTNLYGPGDNYTPNKSHVIPGLIRRYVEAADIGLSHVTNWGSGQALRDFLYVDDLAEAVIYLLMSDNTESLINIGSGEEISIMQLAEKIATLTGFKGETLWDSSKPDGTPRKILDTSKLSNLGWQPSVGLEEGLRLAISDFRFRQAGSA